MNLLNAAPQWLSTVRSHPVVEVGGGSASAKLAFKHGLAFLTNVSLVISVSESHSLEPALVAAGTPKAASVTSGTLPQVEISLSHNLGVRFRVAVVTDE